MTCDLGLLKTAGERPESMDYVLAEGITIAKLAERAGTLSECGSSAAPPSAPSIGRCWRVIIVKYYSHRFAHPARPSDLGRLSLCVSAVGYHCFLVDGDCGVWATGSLVVIINIIVREIASRRRRGVSALGMDPQLAARDCRPGRDMRCSRVQGQQVERRQGREGG